MSVDVLTTIDIDCPIAKVAEFAGNPSNASQWYVHIKSVEWAGEPQIAEGARMAFVAQFLGRRLAYTYEIVELVPGRTLVMRTAEGPFPMETTYTWEALDDGRTRMTLRNRGTPSGFSRLVAPFMAGAMRRANQKDLARLRAICERRPR